ncbi:MAG: hypothetical protein WAO40_09355 [Candidatus Nanopelagicales bacterium]|jgi:hypothetical protein
MSSSAQTVVVARETGDTSSPQPRRRSRPTHVRAVERQPERESMPKLLPHAQTKYFAILVVSVLTAGLLTMLMVNTALAQGAFVESDLQQQRTQLLEAEQALRAELAVAEAPTQVEASARELGMVPQDVPVFVRLSDGAILGNPIPQPAPIVAEPVDESAVSDEVVVDPGVDVAVVDVAGVDDVVQP